MKLRSRRNEQWRETVPEERDENQPRRRDADAMGSSVAGRGGRQRLAALAALVIAASVVVLAAGIVFSQFPRGLIVLAGVAIALAAAWYGLLRTGGARLLGAGIAILALAVTVIMLITHGDHFGQALIIVVGLGLIVVTARSAFWMHVPLPRVLAPQHAMLFYNPKAGGGKAEQFHLADEALARGIEPI